MLGGRDSAVGMPLVATAATGAAGLLLLSLMPSATSRHGVSPVDVSQVAMIPLGDDDSDQALFTVDDMYPGSSATNCLQVTADPQADGSEIRLSASGLNGSLISALQLRVDVGTGGRFGDCTGFVGETMYSGPMVDLAGGGPSTPGVTTGWSLVRGAETRTFRITVRVVGDNRLQGATGRADLQWIRVTASTSPVPTPTISSAPTRSSPSPRPSATPRPSSSTAPTSAVPSVAAPAPIASTGSSAVDTRPHPTPVRSKPASGEDAPARSPSSSVTPPAAARAGGGDDARSGWSGAAKIGWDLLAEAAGHPWFPLGSLLAMWLFLILVDRRDKHDPKLALAPMTRDPYYPFPDDAASTYVVSRRPREDRHEPAHQVR